MTLYEAELKVARLRRALDAADEAYTAAKAAWLKAIEERDNLKQPSTGKGETHD
jgi:hypothetical protein